MNGIINIYKEKGFTSHDVVSIVRRELNKVKTGHTGTLDPDAVGVLPICIGKATKLADYVQSEKKEYIAEVVLGMTTDTLDLSGETLTTTAVCVSENQIIEAVNSFQGEIYQTPPMYSAIKIKGKKLYELARKGVEIERPKRKINIYEIDVLEFISKERFIIRVLCSKGTYIRTLCDDIGKILSTGGTMGELTRTMTGDFFIKDSIKLDDFKKIVGDGNISDIIIPMEQALKKYKSAYVRPEMNKYLYNGGKINFKYVVTDEHIEDNDKVVIYDDNKKLIGVYAFHKKDYLIKPVTMLLV